MQNQSIFGDENTPRTAKRLSQELGHEVESNEKLLWSGFPIQGLRLQAQDAFLIPFSLLWAGFAIFWEFSVVDSNAPVFFDLWGIPFVLVGLWLIFGRFFGDAWSRARTIYGVTSGRVLIITGVWRRTTRSLDLRGLSEINISERSDGRGTITFGPLATFSAGYFGTRGWPGNYQAQSPAFEGIPRVREVQKLIREAQRAVTSQHL